MDKHTSLGGIFITLTPEIKVNFQMEKLQPKDPTWRAAPLVTILTMDVVLMEPHPKPQLMMSANVTP